MDQTPANHSASFVSSNYKEELALYLRDRNNSPMFMLGDALNVLKTFPSACIDFVMTSPPYWGKREYDNGGIGLERDYREYVRNLLLVIGEINRILKVEGSFWLNIGDSYLNKSLVGIPWRVAIEAVGSQGWILRNDVIWNKVKSGMDNTKDRLGNVHEHLFHFVKQQKYYYDVDSIRSKPRAAKVVNGAVISATGVSGVKYKRQIELSTSLSSEEKNKAYKALDKQLLAISAGEISDFRMIIRGQQRITHSDSQRLSGRAKELAERGFYFLRYHPNGSKPTDVWNIVPENRQRDGDHYAAYPEDLCKIPILSTCPVGGVVLDPFCGTGTTLFVAHALGRKSVGIDVSEQYLNFSLARQMLL